MNQLLTIKEIAQALKLPPSTVKYYRDNFADYMPGVKHGRYMKYHPEAIEIIKDISKGFKNNLQQQQIKELLSAKYALNIEENENNSTATTTAATVQQQPGSSLELYREDIKSRQDLAEAIRELVTQNKELIEELKRPWWKKLFGIK